MTEGAVPRGGGVRIVEHAASLEHLDALVVFALDGGVVASHARDDRGHVLGAVASLQRMLVEALACRDALEPGARMFQVDVLIETSGHVVVLVPAGGHGIAFVFDADAPLGLARGLAHAAARRIASDLPRPASVVPVDEDTSIPETPRSARGDAPPNVAPAAQTSPNDASPAHDPDDAPPDAAAAHAPNEASPDPSTANASPADASPLDGSPADAHPMADEATSEPDAVAENEAENDAPDANAARGAPQPPAMQAPVTQHSAIVPTVEDVGAPTVQSTRPSAGASSEPDRVGSGSRERPKVVSAVSGEWPVVLPSPPVPANEVATAARRAVSFATAHAADPHVILVRLALRTGLGLDALMHLDRLGTQGLALLETAVEDMFGIDRGRLREMRATTPAPGGAPP